MGILGAHPSGIWGSSAKTSARFVAKQDAASEVELTCGRVDVLGFRQGR